MSAIEDGQTKELNFCGLGHMSLFVVVKGKGACFLRERVVEEQQENNGLSFTAYFVESSTFKLMNYIEDVF